MEKRPFWLKPKLRHIILLSLLFIPLRFSYYWLSDGFCLDRIKNAFPVTKSLTLKTPSSKEQEKLKSIFTQPFAYFKKGSQAYAFLSEDGEYILKLFKCHHMRSADWLEKLPFFGTFEKARHDLVEKRQKRLENTLKSYTLAATKLRDECAIISMQILPNSHLTEEVTIIDKLGQTFTLPIGKYGFIVQKRAALIFPQIEKWVEEGKLSQAKEAIQSIISLITHRSRKGIQDSDPDLHKNAGLIGTQAIFIDLGGFHANEHVKTAPVLLQDLKKITNNLRLWLHQKSPELALFLENELSEKRY